MKTHEILQPLFDIVCKIHCETSLQLKFDCDDHGKHDDGERIKLISWYIGHAGNPDYGKNSDYLRIVNLDEVKLGDWVAELTELYKAELLALPELK